MILIDTKNNEAYSNVWNSKAAEMIGTHRHTISNWKKKGVDMIKYHHWILYFNEIKLTQKR